MIRAALAVLIALGLAGPAAAQDSPEGPGSEGLPDGPRGRRRPPAWTLGSGRTLWLFPVGDVVQPVYIADIHRPMTAVMPQFYTRTGIYDSTDLRTGLAVGGRFGILRLDPASPGGRSWQLSIDAGLNAQFDSNNKLDNIGWDGKYGLSVTTATGGPLSLRVGILHDSAHIGDEYAERTGRTRIDYTREEFALRCRVSPGPGLRTYAEGGYGYYLLTEEQMPWRAHGGLEYTARRFAPRGAVRVVRGSRFLGHGRARLAAGHHGPGRHHHDLRGTPLAVRRPVQRRGAAHGRVLPGHRGLVHLRALDRHVAPLGERPTSRGPRA